LKGGKINGWDSNRVRGVFGEMRYNVKREIKNKSCKKDLQYQGGFVGLKTIHKKHREGTKKN